MGPSDAVTFHNPRSSMVAMLLLALFPPVQLGGGDGAKGAEPPKRGPVAELFEDDADGLLKVLTNPGDGPGKGEADESVVFSGKRSIKITEYQRFQRRVPGWDFAIRERPAAGQYRYLRFAWKSQGATSMMLQLHDSTDWHIRYTAGPNPY